MRKSTRAQTYALLGNLPKVAVLLVDVDRTYCSLCGGGTTIGAKRHETDNLINFGLNDGCGARFVAISGLNHNVEPRIRALRPELPYIEIADSETARAAL